MSVQTAIVFLIAAVMSAQGSSLKFTIKSPAFSDQKIIPQAYSYSGFGCNGRNVSPPLEWTPGPSETKSYALTVFDPDARRGVGWWHWVAFDIPAKVTSLPENAGSGSGAYMPKGAVQGRNDFSALGWGGPCPPPGPAHHYVFTLYALDVERVFGVSELTSGPSLLNAIKGHVLAQTRLVGRFAR